MKKYQVFCILIFIIFLSGCVDNQDANSAEIKILEEYEIQYAQLLTGIEYFQKDDYLDAFFTIKDLDESELQLNNDYKAYYLQEIKNECLSHFIELGEQAYENKEYDLACDYWTFVDEKLEFEDRVRYRGLCSNGIYRNTQNRKFYPSDATNLYKYLEFQENKIISSGITELKDGVYTYEIDYPKGAGAGGCIFVDGTNVCIKEGMFTGFIYVNDNIYCTELNLKYYKEEQEKQQYEAEHPEPYIGMTKEDLCNSWGNPLRKNITEYSFGTFEQWCYSEHKYIYLENNVVVSIQYSE